MRARSNNHGGTLIEAVLAIVVLGIAMPPLVGLLQQVAARSADDTYQAMAVTYAESLMEEIVSKNFEDPNLANGSFGTEESSRAAYDDVDDYNGLVESPPKRLDGTPLDQYGGFTRTTTVDNVTSAAPDPVTAAANGSTELKRIRVKVTWTGGKGGELTLETMRARHCLPGVDPLDETASAATASRNNSFRCSLQLVSNSACDRVLDSFSLSPAGTINLTTLQLAGNTIWSGGQELPTGQTTLNSGTAADRTVAAGASPTLKIVFARNMPNGPTGYTMVLYFTNSTSSTINFTINW